MCRQNREVGSEPLELLTSFLDKQTGNGIRGNSPHRLNGPSGQFEIRFARLAPCEYEMLMQQHSKSCFPFVASTLRQFATMDIGIAPP